VLVPFEPQEEEPGGSGSIHEAGWKFYLFRINDLELGQTGIEPA
jgi:hypothetical protein